MGRIKIEGFLCERCRHIWKGRGEDMPVVCSRCKSPYWNKPRKNGFSNPVKLKDKKGKKRKKW